MSIDRELNETLLIKAEDLINRDVQEYDLIKENSNKYPLKYPNDIIKETRKSVFRMVYSNTRAAILRHVDEEDKATVTIRDGMISTQRDLMPTFMIIYKDETFDLISYHSTIKTTVYRKINEIAELIKTDIVEEVFYMTIYCLCEASADILYKTSKERQETAKHEFLVCMKADDSLNTMEYAFECDKAKDLRYIAYCLKNGGKDYLEIGKINFMPIVNAFKEKGNDI